VRKPRSRRVPERLWSPESGERAPWDTWRGLDAAQQPSYADAEHLRDVTAQLRRQPPLVFAGEVDDLRTWMGAAARGEAFVLMGGDCAETFAEATADHVRLKIQTLLQMAVVLTYGASLPVIKVGRIAGQYAKPRSSDMETRDGVTLPSYRGDAVNSFEFSPEAREPDPQRLLSLYNHAASTLNLIRAFTKGGYADLRQVHRWNQGFMSNPAYARYESLAEDIHRAIKFMGAAGVDFETLRDVDLYSSHEALLLEYESAMTRIDSRTGEPYNTSAHFLWAGERTREEEGAHIELLSRVRNPIGVKLGPSTTPDQMLSVLDSTTTSVPSEEQFGRYPGLTYETARNELRWASPVPVRTEPVAQAAFGGDSSTTGSSGPQQPGAYGYTPPASPVQEQGMDAPGTASTDATSPEDPHSETDQH